MGVSSHSLRRLTQNAQEGATHAFAICKSGFVGHSLDRMTTLLQHHARGLDAQTLNGLGRCLACLIAESPAELARTQMHGFGKLFQRELAFQIGSRVREGIPNSVGLRRQLKKSRVSQHHFERRALLSNGLADVPPADS
jgi:hypothetical protein